MTGEGEAAAATAKHAAHGLGKGALKGIEELAEVFFEYILPLILVLVGILTAGALGLSGAIATGLSDIQGISSSGLIIGSDLIAAGIWGAAAGACWAASGIDVEYASWVLRPIAGYFTGLVIGELFAALNSQVLNGQIGKLTVSIQTKVSDVAHGG